MFKGFLLALQFLSIVPVRVRGDVSEADMRASVMYFPLVGMLMGAAALGVAHLCGMVFSPALTSGLVLVSYVVLNGGFHLDGLADTADGMACKRDIPGRLDVMREGTVGPVGAVSIVLSLMIKFLFLLEAAGLGYFGYSLALLLAPAASKWIMAVAMAISKPARPDGLGKIFIAKITRETALSTIALAALIAIIIRYSGAPSAWYLFALALMTALLIYSIISALLMRRVFGGQTGDTIGATGELAETITMLGIILWSKIMM